MKEIKQWYGSLKKNGKKTKIAMILVEELATWKSTTKVKEEELIRLVDRLFKVIKK